MYKWPLVKRTHTQEHIKTRTHSHIQTHSKNTQHSDSGRNNQPKEWEKHYSKELKPHSHKNTETHTHTWQQKGIGPWLSWFAGFSVSLVFWQTSKLIDRFIYVKKKTKQKKQTGLYTLPTYNTTNSAVKTTNQNLIDASQNTMCSIVFREIQNLTNNSISSLIRNRNLVLTTFF